MATTIKLDPGVMAGKVAAGEVQFLPCSVEADVPSTEVQARFTALSTKGEGLHCSITYLPGCICGR